MVELKTVFYSSNRNSFLFSGNASWDKRCFDIWHPSFFGFPEWKSVGHLRSLHSRSSQFVKEKQRLSSWEEGALAVAAFSAHLGRQAGELSSEQHTCNTTKRHVGETLWQLMCSLGRWIYINNLVDLNQITSTWNKPSKNSVFCYYARWNHHKSFEHRAPLR